MLYCLNIEDVNFLFLPFSFRNNCRASRGIDFSGVDHVVLFDFPRDPSEYVRRVGRTARGARGKGKAFIFVVGKQVGLARRIIERNEKGHPVHDVPNAYEFTT
jgi:ATP-dependent RNA helicase DDX18/HAS1